MYLFIHFNPPYLSLLLSAFTTGWWMLIERNAEMEVEMEASRDFIVGIVLKRKYEELGCSGGAALFYWFAQIMSISRQMRKSQRLWMG